MKQPPKNPFSHPSMAQQTGQPPARKGVSRLAPGTKVGETTQAIPPGLRDAPAVADQAREPDPRRNRKQDKQERRAAPAEPVPGIDDLEERALPDVPAPVLPKVEPKIYDRRHDVVNKLLTFKQAMTRQFNVGGMVFTIKVLSPAETLAATRMYEAFPKDKQTVLAGRALMFAASLVDIDGVALEDHSGSDDADPTVRKFYELMQWQLPILDTVLEAREKLMDEVRREYTPDFLTQGK